MIIPSFFIENVNGAVKALLYTYEGSDAAYTHYIEEDTDYEVHSVIDKDIAGLIFESLLRGGKLRFNKRDL